MPRFHTSPIHSEYEPPVTRSRARREHTDISDFHELDSGNHSPGPISSIIDPVTDKVSQVWDNTPSIIEPVSEKVSEVWDKCCEVGAKCSHKVGEVLDKTKDVVSNAIFEEIGDDY